MRGSLSRVERLLRVTTTTGLLKAWVKVRANISLCGQSADPGEFEVRKANEVALAAQLNLLLNAFNSMWSSSPMRFLMTEVYCKVRFLYFVSNVPGSRSAHP